MLRTVVHIDEDACNGCGLCVAACHEGAIGMVGGKARLLRDDYCDGMGDCLPACPRGAIAFEQREAAAYDEAAVQTARTAGIEADAPAPAPFGGAGFSAAGWSAVPEMPATSAFAVPGVPDGATFAVPAVPDGAAPSHLAQWPCQIKLAPITAPYFAGADLLVAADCTAFACADFHGRFMAGRVTLVGCPKLDGVDYAEKLGAILAANDVRSVLVARMDVPCCGGLQTAVERAVAASGKVLPLTVATLGRDGRVLAVR